MPEFTISKFQKEKDKIITKGLFIGSVVGISIGFATLFGCISNANNLNSTKKSLQNTVLIRKETNEINNMTYLSAAIIASSVSLGLAGFLRVA